MKKKKKEEDVYSLSGCGFKLKKKKQKKQISKTLESVCVSVSLVLQGC